MTEQEMIQQHINECSHRIDVINDFIASNSSAIKEKGEENILILKTAISALEEIQKKQGWIPVTERLPETRQAVIVTVHSSEWISDYNSVGFPEEEKKHHSESQGVYVGYLEKDGKWWFLDEDMCEVLCEKEFGNDKGRVYDVVIAWMPLPEPYKMENEQKGDFYV